jgi:hypothetical protein
MLSQKGKNALDPVATSDSLASINNDAARKT